MPAEEPPGGVRESVGIPLAEARLEADLVVPAGAAGVVVFAHGSGSSRHSPRNRYVAEAFVRAGFATFLMDLLTAAEEEIDVHTGRLRFAIPLLARRLTGAVDWVGSREELTGLPVATFGASTGAAAALVTAADRPDSVRAVLSRGGRPDLAGEALGRVRAPTLLVVGGADTDVLELNRQAAERLTAAEWEISVVPGATHLFPEPGALDRVVELSVAWLRRWLAAPAR
ncbi:MAG TPA: alpha/beta fold hydrolase [Geodermatophilus sp.]|nr:alpha/beta fold hydrolase [Geodermatophilus sp.]